MGIIEPFAGYMLGAMRSPLKVRHFEGNTYVMGNDEAIYNSHPLHHTGVYPLRFEVEYDINKEAVTSLFFLETFDE